MPITDPEWSSIAALAENVSKTISGRRIDFFKTGTVVKRDVANKLVWVDEFANQAIPIVGFDYEVKYYDEGSSGIVSVKKAIVTVAVPKVGQKVLVGFEMGLRRLPRCLGVLQGTNWIDPEG